MKHQQLKIDIALGTTGSMKKFKCKFIGRKIGAIGIVHPCEIEVCAPDGEAALLACYDTHEHISYFVCEPLPNPNAAVKQAFPKGRWT